MFKHKTKLSTMITILVCLVVIVSLLITDILISTTINKRVKGNIEESAIILSEIVAKSPIVKNGLKYGKDVKAIQAYANEIQETSNVLFVVVMDMNGKRKSHPNPQLIGKKFVGGDEKDVLKGKHYVSISEGTLGKSLRAFSPVYDDNNKQVGAVAVGISLKRVDEALREARKNIMIGTIIGILVGIFGAYVVAKYIKKILLGLEPLEIAKIHEERNTMLQSVHEGVVAVDQNSIITLVNKSATRIFKKAGLKGNPVGMRINDYMPSFHLDQVLKTRIPELDEEQSINGVLILVNKVPLIVNRQVVGAISTFRDKTEINQLAEQLTGVKTYAEALRAQSHEFMNKLHVILGMVRMGMYDKLTEFVFTLVDHRNHEVGNITKNVKDPALAGFIVGKLSYAREANVNLGFEIKTVIPEPLNLEITHDIITILGNLIDNAIEAIAEKDVRTIDVTLSYLQEHLEIIVIDTGPGFSKKIIDYIFEKGFSTKGQNRGYGLYLVKQCIKKLGGDITINSKSSGGAKIIVELPFAIKKGGGNND